MHESLIHKKIFIYYCVSLKKKYIQSIFQELYSHLRTLSRLYRFVFARLGVLFDNPINKIIIYIRLHIIIFLMNELILTPIIVAFNTLIEPKELVTV